MSFFLRARIQFKKSARNILLLLTGAFLAVLILTLSGIYYFRAPLIRNFVIGRIVKVTGFKIRVRQVLHQFPLRITLRDVTMYNPSGYKPRVFATSPYFYIDIDPVELIRGKIFRIRAWRLIIDELHIEKNKNGVTNGSLLKSIKNFARFPAPPAGAAVPPSDMDFLMDRLEVKILHISYRDRSGVVPRKTIKNLKLSPHVYENVTDFSGMIDQMEEEVLKEMELAHRVELGPFLLERSLRKATHAVKGTTEKVAEGAGKVVKTTAVTPAVVVKEKTGEILKSTAELIGLKSSPSPNPSSSVLANRPALAGISAEAGNSGTSAAGVVSPAVSSPSASPQPVASPSSAV